MSNIARHLRPCTKTEGLRYLKLTYKSKPLFGMWIISVDEAESCPIFQETENGKITIIQREQWAVQERKNYCIHFCIKLSIFQKKVWRKKFSLVPCIKYPFWLYIYLPDGFEFSDFDAELITTCMPFLS